MPNYNESTVAGTKWQRCKIVSILNAYGKVPQANFHEEIIANIDSSIVQLGQTSCSIDFDQQNGVIPLVNPLTGESLGTTCTHVELYTILYSLYMQAAAARDAAQQTP